MDIRFTERGQLVAELGELPLETNETAKLEMYLRVALIDAINEDFIEQNYVHELKTEQQISEAEITFRQNLLRRITSSPYGTEFEESRFRVSLTPASNSGDLRVRVVYSSQSRETGEDITNDIFINAGKLILNDANFTYPLLDSTTDVLIEEYILESPTDKILVATESDQPLFVLPSGDRLDQGVARVDVSEIPENQRRTLRIQRDDGRTALAGSSDPEIAGDNGDTIFARDIATDVGSGIITTITDLVGNIDTIQYIPEAEDHLIYLNSGDTRVEIAYTYGNPLAQGGPSIVVRGEELDESLIPFPASDNQVPKVVFLDKVLEPGVYTLIYQAGLKRQYDGSMWRE